jgi:hypothetical protein
MKMDLLHLKNLNSITWQRGKCWATFSSSVRGYIIEKQYHLAKRKMLGNIKFIGKWLYNRKTVSPGKEENAGHH